MSTDRTSFLLIGESDVGKTHYGAQLLRRLNSSTTGALLLDSQNIKPFRQTMDNLSRGLAGSHTPLGEASISEWTIEDKETKRTFELAWPDYAGEQVTTMINTRGFPAIWKERVVEADAWAFMVRPSQIRLPADVLTRQVRLKSDAVNEDVETLSLSPQSRLIEILQMLRYKFAAHSENWNHFPPLCLMLSCWDELNTDLSPEDYCERHLPLLFAYIKSNWPKEKLAIFGVAAVGEAISDTEPSDNLVNRGPEMLGFVVNDNGAQCSDLFNPIRWMLSVSEES